MIPLRLGLGVLIVLGLFAAAPGPAAARVDGLQVSLDARRWFATLDRPLFEEGRRWVPGDTETVTVWARNASTEGAGLTVRVIDRNGTSRLDDALQLTATANGQPLDTAAGAAGFPVRPGDPVRVDITLTFPESAGNRTQRLRTDLDVRFTLTQLVDDGDGSGPPPGTDRPGPPRTGLPSTGGPAAAGALLVAGPLLLATGAALLGGRRRTPTTRGAR